MGEGSRPGARAQWAKVLREPLVHFMALGGLLFALDHAFLARAGDPHTIVMSREVDHEARQLFVQARGREPNAEELGALHRAWLDNEVLYREGLALQVDKGDSAIRERVIFKALSVVDANVRLPPFDDRLLSDWFEAHRARYDEPARFDFQEAVPSADRSEAAVRALVSRLNAGASGDAEAALRVFKGRPRANLVQSYGDAFAQAVEAAPRGEWRAVPALNGWRAIRVEAVAPPKPADFERLRGVVLQDWTDATLSAQRSAAVHALAKKYDVKIEVAVK